MPFVETYSVNFGNGNVHPHVDLHGWSDMALFPPTPDDTAQRIPDPSGYIFRITRKLTARADESARNIAYVVPPAAGVPLDARLFMRVTFDLPRAEGFSLADHGPLGDEVEPLREQASAEHGPFAGEIGLPGSVEAGHPGPSVGEVSVPEPWVVALSVSPASDLLSDSMLVLTCQFNSRLNGVRLNTPRNAQGTGPLQTDTALCLETPLNYDIYQGGYMAFPNGTDGVVDPPIFSLEHSFCGWNAAANKHTPGCGWLKIYRSWQPEAQDHRVFSSDAFTSSPGQVTAIGALGVSLVTLNGFGRMSVRLRTFSIWVNESL